ncbi:acyl-CoA thioesterase [Pseudomonas costantinii]|uniref:acyl-CoA thioesterase n=1 Tax=Pseudomonas costantinii TaxID=168469 RepID=UPI0015A2DE9D|nr:thioesterase family protein [Pseudomonas costantinii]NVZ18759.1 acyl-CoA thioesterase [Pseudomonas costantinii]
MVPYVVAFADTDAGGVMHHARYIELAEYGYHAWFRERSMALSRIGSEHGFSMVVRRLTAKYLAPIFLEDEVCIHTCLSSIDRTGLNWETDITKAGKRCLQLSTRMVCLERGSRTILPVPASIIALLAPRGQGRRHEQEREHV